MTHRLFNILLVIYFSCQYLSAQNIDVDLLNGIITEMIGEQDNIDIPVYKTISQACDSDYINCKKGKIIGLDFQFSNLNGYVPKRISQLKDLKKIDLSYNYLSGPLPNGLSSLKKIEELKLQGNFITGPLPLDLTKIDKNATIDLSENVIDIGQSKIKRRCNIYDQVNLEGCRSPDSIYISKDLNNRIGYESKITVDTDSIEVEEVPEKKDSSHTKDGAKMVESMPRFPGCENQGLAEKELDICAKTKLLKFIYKNLKYPKLGQKKRIEGTVLIRYVILRDGSIDDVKLIKDPGGRLGNSGQWIVNRMNYLCDKWQPGIQRGRPVKVKFTLPLKFKLN